MDTDHGTDRRMETDFIKFFFDQVQQLTQDVGANTWQNWIDHPALGGWDPDCLIPQTLQTRTRSVAEFITEKLATKPNNKRNKE